MEIKQPTPAEIKEKRLAAGLTQTEAAALIHTICPAWQKWEAAENLKTHRKMPLGKWELFLMKLKELNKQ